MPYAANVVVEVAGVSVVPGDYVYADAAGAVAIPAANIDRIIEEARMVDTEDSQYADQIRNERVAEFRH